MHHAKYLNQGSPKITLTEEYNSNNTKILTIDEVKQKLLTIPLIQEELEAWKGGN